jgi:hypothetical protein
MRLGTLVSECSAGSRQRELLETALTITVEAILSLRGVFTERVRRASRVLEKSTAGPRRIRFTSTSLSDVQALTQLHEKFPRKAPGVLYLYQLSVFGNDESALSKLRMAFRAARSKHQLKMSRDNTDHQASKSMYVGTSADMHSRFRSHLGRGKGAETWAMYLSAWAAPTNVNFVVEYYEFKDALAEDIELIEGVLWDSLRPMFGKKGGR